MTLLQDSKGQRIFTYVSMHITTRGFAPTIREIMEGVGISSTSVVSRHLNQLHDLGHLVRSEGLARGIALGDAAGMNLNFSLMCHAATRWAGTDVAAHLHGMCPGHVFQAWDSREFDCACTCGHDA